MLAANQRSSRTIVELIVLHLLRTLQRLVSTARASRCPSNGGSLIIGDPPQ